MIIDLKLYDYKQRYTEILHHIQYCTNQFNLWVDRAKAQ